MRHGTFVYEVDALARECGGVGPAAVRLKNMTMDHAWIKVHGYRGAVNRTAQMVEFCAALRDLGIEPMAWGWCQGADGDIEREAALAVEETQRYGMRTYIADIEGDGTVNASRWSEAEAALFFEALKKGMPEARLGVSSFALPELHGDTAAVLAMAARSGATIGAPQIYWFNHPSPSLARRYECAARNPAVYAGLALDQWRRCGFGQGTMDNGQGTMDNGQRAMDNGQGTTDNGQRTTGKTEIWATGQAYWGEGEFTQGEAEERMREFLGTFERWGELAGWNWWHAGGGAAMSAKMREIIAGWVRRRNEAVEEKKGEGKGQRAEGKETAVKELLLKVGAEEALGLAAALRRMAGLIEAGL